MENRNETGKFRLRVDLVLTVLFLITIFFFGIMTLVTDWEGVYRAGTRKAQLNSYLADPDHYSKWDLMAARIASLDDYIAQNIYGHTELGYVNSGIQYAMGKRVITTGASNMVTLNTGHLYDLQSRVPMDAAVESITDMKTICGDIPFLYVYEHPTLYDEERQMPAGYGALDYSAEMANEVIDRVTAQGIPVMDSRDILTASGLELQDYLMVTDQHWATRAAIVMAQAMAQRISEMTGVQLDASLLDLDRFDTETYEKRFLGKYGQRIGTMNVDPDDITVFWPTYDTDITRHTLYLKETFDEQGPFRDSVIRWKYLQPDEGKSWNIKAYFDYGLTENYDLYTNPNGADITVMVLKDSYSAGIASFLSLTCRNVVAVDLRRSEDTLEQWIGKYNPDIVITAYSLQMLKQDEYAFQ